MSARQGGHCTLSLGEGLPNMSSFLLQEHLEFHLTVSLAHKEEGVENRNELVAFTHSE